MRFLAMVLAICAAWGQPGAVVTARMRIEIDKKVHIARKINGRWWSEDNRQLTQTNVGWLWSVSGGNARHLVRFDHHRPFNTALIASVTREMGPNEVRAAIGPPNSVFPSDKPETHQHWYYYGADGSEFSIFFSHSGGIFTASFEPTAKSMPQDVPHLAFKGPTGRTAREAFADRKAGQPRRAERTSATYTIPAAAPPAPIRPVPQEDIASITIGTTRQALIDKLGEPATRFSIAGEDGTQETIYYDSTAGGRVAFTLVNAKVTGLPR